MKNYLKTIFIALLMAMGMTACNDDDESNPRLVENAGLVENGQTLSPGETVHLTGTGYLSDDEVMLNFYWETGETVLPEGSIKGYYAEILESSPDGITIRLPYRKPEARVEVLLARGGRMMHIGELYVKSGTTPKEARLYGINNNLHNKGFFIDNTQITCVFNEEEGYVEWDLEEHPDFHSVVACWGNYGLCGLSKVNGEQYPFFFDFCTAKWKQLSEYPTIALVHHPSCAMALQTPDGKYYGFQNITSELETSNYATAITKTRDVNTLFLLPESLKAEQFGEYPGVFTGTDLIFLSANKGDGKWTPVIFTLNNRGFHALDDIEADGLIPFSFVDKDKKWRFGYIVARDNAVNGTELYLFDNDVTTLFDEPYAVYPNRAVSASANYDNPGTLTVHFTAYRSGNVTEDFVYETKEWKYVNFCFGLTADEVVWTN